LLAASRERRKLARLTRERSVAVRDKALEHRWTLWEAGFVPEPPSYVPLAWEAETRELAHVLAVAAVRCEDVADRATRALETIDDEYVNALRVVAALCLVTAERIMDVRDGASIALSACEKALDRFRKAFEGEPDPTALEPALSAGVRAVRAALARVAEEDEE
jgi:hypothetical protein